MVWLNVKEEIFFLYQKALKISGTWPLDRGKYGSTIIFWSTALLQLVVTMVHVRSLFKECSPNIIVWSDLRVLVWEIFGLAYLLVFRLITSEQIIPLIESTMEDWSSITDPEEREIMIRHDKYGRWMFATQFTIIMAKAISKTQLIWSSNDSLTWTTVSRSLRLIIYCMNGLMINSIRALFWSLAIHLSSQYKILKNRFRDSLLIGNKNESRKVFRRLVERHNELLDLGEHLENSFKVFNTFIVVAAQLLACIFAVPLIEDIKAFRFLPGAQNLSVVTYALASLWITYYAGDYLSACSEEVGEVFTQCNWYNLSKEFRTNYGMVIMRCRRPPRLTIIKMYKLNLSNYKYVLKALYSYISLMVAITKDKA